MSKGHLYVYQGHSELAITPTECSSSHPLIQKRFYCRLSSMGPGWAGWALSFYSPEDNRQRHKVMFKYSSQLPLKLGNKFHTHTLWLSLGINISTGLQVQLWSTKRILHSILTPFQMKKACVWSPGFCLWGFFIYFFILPLSLWRS